MDENDSSSLADFIKSTHRSLRIIAKETGDKSVEEIWKSHIQNREHLQKYAVAMHTLATKHWQSKDNKSRVTWTYDSIKDYFHGGIMQQKIEKEERKVSFFGDEVQTHFKNLRNRYDKQEGQLTVLDVGSCYNPFGQYEDLQVTAIDLCPANADVKECDFLSLEVKEETPTTVCTLKGDLLPLELSECKENLNKRPHDCQLLKNTKKQKLGENTNFPMQIVELNGCSFDILIFSLLLEYIPSPRLRFDCCLKAYNLLKPNGVLCIITPDSKHQNANVHLYKMWQITLGYLGFQRIKYEKFPHFHGMLFRKAFIKSVWKEDAERELKILKGKKVQSKFKNIDYVSVPTCIYIPQDLQDTNT